MLFLWSVNLKDDMEKEFQEWAKKNIAELGKHVPSHWKLWGIYGATFGLGPRDVTVIWQFDRWADFDAMREYSNDVSSRLNSEFGYFVRGGSSRSIVLREVSEWVISEPKKPEK